MPHLLNSKYRLVWYHKINGYSHAGKTEADTFSDGSL